MASPKEFKVKLNKWMRFVCVCVCVMESNEMAERMECHFIHENGINGQFSISLLAFFHDLFSFTFALFICTLCFLST